MRFLSEILYVWNPQSSSEQSVILQILYQLKLLLY